MTKEFENNNKFTIISSPQFDSKSELVAKGRRAPQYIAGLIASLAALSTGTTIAWTSQISDELLDGDYGFKITSDDLGWIGSLMPLGAAALSLFTGSICDILGRKLTMLLLIIPATAGWALLACADSLAMLYCGRFITGMVAGGFTVMSSIYCSEIAQKEIRGALGSYTQLMISVGILFANGVASLLSILVYTIVCGIVPIVFGVLFVFMPETPIYLLKKGKVDEARSVLVRLRGMAYDVDNEIKDIQSNLEEQQRNSGTKVILDSLKKRSSQKACLIGCGLMIFKVTCGIDAITAYTSYIFTNADMGLDSKVGTIILNLFQVTSAIFQSVVVDRCGRRLLLWLSGVIMTICLTIVGLTLMLKTRDLIVKDYYVYIDYLPLVALVIFTVAFSLGLGPIPWLMLGEIFPQEIKSVAASASSFISWLTAFGVTKLFLVIDDSWGGDIAFFIFAISCAIAVVFTLFLVPETKNKSFDEIQKALQ